MQPPLELFASCPVCGAAKMKPCREIPDPSALKHRGAIDLKTYFVSLPYFHSGRKEAGERAQFTVVKK